MDANGAAMNTILYTRFLSLTKSFRVRKISGDPEPALRSHFTPLFKNTTSSHMLVTENFNCKNSLLIVPYKHEMYFTSKLFNHYYTLGMTHSQQEMTKTYTHQYSETDKRELNRKNRLQELMFLQDC